ncbi:MAG: hypothetical protein E4H19_04290 [Chromatiales bacterium]|jgi:hypothetical protein|nr:MAG: hypothetical protein E4H19_04290 [Chromatiales bacterium]
MLTRINRGSSLASAGSARLPTRFLNSAAALVLALFAVQTSAQVIPPFGLPDQGVLRLQLGETVTEGGLHSPRRFVHEPSGLSQSISNSGKCGLSLGGPSALAVLVAAGGNGSLGLGPDSIGVYDGSKGVACYRITATEGESVTFGLGADVSASPLIDANAFYRLELDVEVKQNAEFLLQILSGTAVTEEFRLRTGGSVVAGEGSADPDSPDRIFNCSAASDSGPDSGARDNCRWIVNALGQQFRLIALQGEGSWEGGGDFGAAAYANNSLAYLTKADIGALGCNSNQVPEGTGTSTIGDGTSTAQCAVTRVDPTGLGGSCTTAIGYVFRTSAGATNGCELNKNPGEQLAASIDILFPPEPSTALGAEPLTTIQFSTDVPGVLVSFTPQRCIGTVVPDRNGEPTIAEVLSVPGFVPDIVPGTPQKDWACVLNNTQEYVGPGLMQVRQKLAFWGDIIFKR